MDFDSMVPDAPAAQAPAPQQPTSFDAMQEDSAQPNDMGQSIQAGVEGALGPLAGPGVGFPGTMGLMKTGLGIGSNKAILTREEEHPLAHFVGEMTGLALGPKGTALESAGKTAAELAGIGTSTYGAKIGSSIVKNAAELAAYNAQDDLGKAMLGDPNVSAQSAITHIGLGAALGGIGGGMITGVRASPLWEAAVAPKLDSLLNKVKNHINNETSLEMSGGVQDALNTLGTGLNHQEVDPDVFHSKMQEVLNSKNPLYKANIHPYTPEEYGGMKTYLHPDGKSGYAVKPDGDLVSVFSQERGRGEQIVDDAVLNKGASKLDAYDINGKLPNLYGKYMDETARSPFNPEYAPAGWDTSAHGTPDFVTMGLNPEKVMANKDAGKLAVDKILQAAMSDNPKAAQYFGDLIRSEHPAAMEAINNLKNSVHESVAKSLGVPLDEIASYDKSDAGHELFGAFKKELTTKYGPVADMLEKRNMEAATIPISDASRLKQYNKFYEQGMEKFGANSPLFENYKNWGNRLLDAESIGSVDKLKTELQGEINKAVRAGDTNTIQALSDIRHSLSEFQENEIENNAYKMAGHRFKGAPEIIAERQRTNAAYRQFRQTMDTLTDHIGVGRATGYKGLIDKLGENITPEQLLNKMSPKNNADIVPFLQQHFPETLEHVKKNELKNLLKSSVKDVAGESRLDVNKLGKVISEAQKGQSKLVDFAVNPDAQKKIQAGRTVLNSIPNPKNSGTPAGMLRLFRYLPTSGLAAIGWLTGHGPLASMLLGETASRIGLAGPEAYKLAYLKFLASDKPINARGFQAASEYFMAARKGAEAMKKSADAVFKPGFQVLQKSQMPSPVAMVALDKMVASNDPKQTDKLMQAQQAGLGHYMPDHQTAMTTASMASLQYLKSVKPQPQQLSPLDRPIEPTKAQEARYQRALGIAQQPALVLQHIKDGTLQTTDIQDLHAMYPAAYQQMAQHLTNAMTNRKENEGIIPYKVRVGTSLFLGQPMDSSMLPASIQSAQPMPKNPPTQPGPKMGKKGTTNLGKSNKSYQTQTQSAESDRGNRD